MSFLLKLLMMKPKVERDLDLLGLLLLNLEYSFKNLRYSKEFMILDAQI
jgi:hypothetical protein